VVDDADDSKCDDKVLAGLSELRLTIAELTVHTAKEHDRAQAREQVIDRLHAEVQRSRAGEARELLRPAITDLRRLRDDLCAQARSVPETMARAELAVLLESYAESVVLILERCGVNAITPEPLTAFDPRGQQVGGVAETTDPELDGVIASVVCDGYAEADTGRQLAPAKVIVYRHSSSSTTDTAAAATTDAAADRQAG